MSKIIETKKFDDESIISLWREAFGDTREEIEFFLDNCENKSVLCYYKNNELLSMLFLVDCTVSNERYKYIYAACTRKRARKSGVMTELLDFAKECYSGILLIPADEKLSKYYKKRGFTHKIEIDFIRFYEIEDVIEYLFEGCELSRPYALAYIGD
ncbi:MAG: GNAT family N-acetyltransferase [Acetobacter sp.]|nr:GNAT family N-acetyltransferase [Bacteroides sp.]MCM1340507.1 GNAT family N-acetyltransferase [Acetobacter sp.]MCM1433247.1 GNAT family N-acetyltransferase [Clostridiales bacterium]